jgi:translation elongation factor EF-1beta
MERMKAKAAAVGKVVKHVVAKSLIIWEVKPWEEETNLDDLAKKILDIKIDGLEWKTEYKKEPVAYGIFKLVIGAVVEDEKVSTDDIAETIQGFEDMVQSVDIAAFNKL